MSLAQLLANQRATGYRYQEFGLEGGKLVPGEKMRQKLQAFGAHLPESIDGRVLDLGSQLGFWCWLALERGASEVVGVEIAPRRIQWCRSFQTAAPQFAAARFVAGIGDAPGPFSLVLCFSVYHHLYGRHQDHDFWMSELAGRLEEGGCMLYEGPFDSKDYVIAKKFPGGEWKREEIEAAFSRHFSRWEHIGSSIHAGTREAVILWK